jgi:hypothetical protein
VVSSGERVAGESMDGGKVMKPGEYQSWTYPSVLTLSRCTLRDKSIGHIQESIGVDLPKFEVVSEVL